MNDDAKLTLHMFGVWSGVIFTVVILIAFALLAKFFPPPAPSMTANAVATMYSENRLGIRVSMVLLMIAAVFYTNFISTMAHYVSIVEKHVGVLTFLVFISGALNLLAFGFPAIWWLSAAFRPEASAATIQALHTTGWLAFLGLIGPTFLLYFALTITAFVDRRQAPLFPRWFGYFNILAFSLFLPGQLIFFFHDGIFAWNGLIGFWLVAVDFFAQLFLTIYFLRLAVKRARTELAD